MIRWVVLSIALGLALPAACGPSDVDDAIATAQSNLTAANVVPIRDDVHDVLAKAPAEVPGLIAALREGRIDGSAYEGECACLVGTIANIRGENYQLLGGLRPDSSRPAERWFLGIRRGDTHESSQIVALTVEWAEQWLREQDGLPAEPEAVP